MKQNKNINKYVIVSDPKSIVSEALQHIQINLDFASVDQDNKVIAVTSAVPGEGKSTTIVNLACIYAQKEKKVVIIDLDLRKPRVHRFFNIANDEGVTDYCVDKISYEKLIRKMDFVDVITAGTSTPFPGKILDSTKFASLIEKLKEQYDYIFLDTPPVLSFSDALVVSKFVNQFILVAQKGKTKKNDLAETVNLFKQNNIEIAGVVLTKVDYKGTSKYKYNYEYRNR